MNDIFFKENFLNNSQIKEIRQQVKLMQDYYKPLNGAVPTDNLDKICCHTLGNACYTEKDLDPELNRIMIEKFNWLYDHTIEFLKNIFYIDEITLSPFSVPGFHVFRGVELSHYFTTLQYHVDHYALENHDVKDKASRNFFYSFTALIENSDDPAFLDVYKQDNIYYQYNNLYVWNGYVPHKIGASKLNEKDNRITYQGHLYRSKKTKKYHIFF